jgi:hypothetical protein
MNERIRMAKVHKLLPFRPDAEVSQLPLPRIEPDDLEKRVGPTLALYPALQKSANLYLTRDRDNSARCKTRA